MHEVLWSVTREFGGFSVGLQIKLIQSIKWRGRAKKKKDFHLILLVEKITTLNPRVPWKHIKFYIYLTSRGFYENQLTV